MNAPTETRILIALAGATLFGCASNPPPAAATAAAPPLAPALAAAPAKAPEPAAVGTTPSRPDPKTASVPATYLPKDKVTAAFATKGAPPLYTLENFKVIAAHRDEGKKPAELHSKDTDIFYIVDGSATFVTGGEMVDATPEKDPDELRGPSIKGGEPHHLQKGDVIVIPRGMPHQFTELKGPFDYFIVKVRQ